MEAHIKYLDELIYAISESRLDVGNGINNKDKSGNNSGNERCRKLAIPSENHSELKSLKIIITLINNLKENAIIIQAKGSTILSDDKNMLSLKTDIIFSKTIEAIDLLIKSKPYLLWTSFHIEKSEFNVSDTNDLGIITLFEHLIQVAMININLKQEKNVNTSRIWLLRKKLGEWCRLTTCLYSPRMKVSFSNYILNLLDLTELELTNCIMSDGFEAEDMYQSLKKLYVLLYFFSGTSGSFGNSLTFCGSIPMLQNWDFYFQRSIRILLFVLNSIRIVTNDEPPIEFVQIQSLFISLLTDYLVNGTIKSGNCLKIGSTDRLQFVLSTIHKFMKRLEDITVEENTTISKCLLRIYSICIFSDSNQLSVTGTKDSFQYKNQFVDIFHEYLPLKEWIDLKKLDESAIQAVPFNTSVKKSITIILFDMLRRHSDETELTYNQTHFMWTLSNERVEKHVLPYIVTPFATEQVQLENLRRRILKSFNDKDIGTSSSLQISLNKLDSSILTNFGSDLVSLLETVSAHIKISITKKQQNELVLWAKILGLLTCYQVHFASDRKISISKWTRCIICDNNTTHNSFKQIRPDRQDALKECEPYKLLLKYFISNLPLMEFSDPVQASILLCMRRIFNHYQPPQLNMISNEIVTNGSCNVFEIVSKSFTGKNRYLRILSGKLIPLWNISATFNSEDQHTAILIQFLQSQKAAYMTEVLIGTWVELTLTTSDEIFDTLLLKLIDIFNSADYTIHNMMTFKIKRMAKALNKTPYQLLSPILPILLRQIGKNIVERKLTFQRLIELLGYSSKTVLEIYQRYIIPYAITQYKTDAFTEIAKIISDDNPDRINDIKAALLEKNSRQIFAVALVKYGLFSLDTLEALFLNRLPSFDKGYVSAYLPDYRTLAEFLKLYKNDDLDENSGSENEKTIICALRYLVTDYEKDKRHGTKYKNITDWDNKREEKFQKNLQINILGIFQVFSCDIHDVEGKTSHYEKVRVVNGISFLIKHANKKSIISALAQISICLQTAIEIDEVRTSALKCLKLLVISLNDDELSTIIDIFISYILENWSSFNYKIKSNIYGLIDILIKDKTNLVMNIKPFIMLAMVNKTELGILSRSSKFARMVSKVRSNTNWIPIFAENLKGNNKYVIHQTLNNVETFLKRKQSDSSYAFFSNIKQESNVTVLLSELLSASYKFRSIDKSLSEQCTRCIGIIGVLDMNVYDMWKTTSSNDRVYDLNDEVQTIKFLVWILNSILVPAFWQSENPSKQLFVALVMQESLKFCGLSSASWDINKPELYPNEMKLWNKFNTISKTTLYPLLSSLYLAQSWKEYVPLKYPSYNEKEGFKIWIKSVTLDLLKLGTEEDHPLHVFSSLIREDDGALSNFLLPYITMDIIMKAEPETVYEKIMQNLTTEFQFIFNYDLVGLNHHQVESLKMCFETIFSVIEYCKKWITQFKQNYNDSYGTFIIKEERFLRMLNRTESFLAGISSSLLAKRSLETNAFERSVLYLEQCIRDSKKERALADTKLLLSLQSTYEEIGDIDSIDGLLKTFSTNNLSSKIQELQYSDSWKMAQHCFESLGNYNEDMRATSKMLKLDFDHQNYSKVLTNITPKIKNVPMLLDKELVEWYKMGIESANLVGDINELKNWLENIETLHSVNDPELLLHYNIGKALSYVNSDEPTKITEYINKCFKLMGMHFTAPSKETTFIKNQDLLMKLHGLYDIHILSSSKDNFLFESNISLLDFRMKRVGADFVPNHYLLSIRKSYASLKNIEYTTNDLARSFFRISELSRKNSRLDLSCESLMSCLKFGQHGEEVEFAEILWTQGENDRAIKLVKEIHEKYDRDPTIESRDKAKILLKYTEWLDQSNYSSSEQIIKQYANVLDLDPQWEKPYYSMGLYYSRLLERKKAEGYVTNGRLEYKSISYFLLAFEKNAIKVRETLPKVVTFWLDTASIAMNEPEGHKKEILLKTTEDICRHIENSLKNCPKYIWYSVLTQLLSRLLHSHEVTSQLIISILLNLSYEYPSHMLWYISVLLNSTSKERVKRGKRIIEKYALRSKNSKQYISQSYDLVTALTTVCLKELKNSSTRSGKSLEKDFNFNMNMAPSSMVVPVRINLEMLSPLMSESVKTYQPFGLLVTIARFGSSYKVFSSLKKPKKLNIVGSDGNIYGIMCKKEDVRQDNQYMQFATTMDFMLGKEVDATKRNLGITTYSVMSLREDCGLIEIVPNVVTLRSIFVTKYESLKLKYSLKGLYDQWQNVPSDQKLGFYSTQLGKFPPVLHQWFLETFPDPISWFNSRNEYSRSYAVMSMVGHILGLGDRHCENILLDIQTGKVLHVDFDCLFEKGKRLPVPEIVPFRLTQNLFDGLGIMGTEGTFKKSSEVTVSIMRQNEVSLVNVIETIMYDRNMDYSIQKALKVLRNKIRGIDSRDGLVLSVPGQVETLIQEATSSDNLSQMYIGWLPFW